MKKAAILAAALIIASCSSAPTAKISGTIDNLKDTSIIVINGHSQILDTVKVNSEGAFSYKLEFAEEVPEFCHFMSGNSCLASLVLVPGDKVGVKVAGGDYTVEGSEESSLMKGIYDESIRTEKEMIANPENAGELYIQYNRFARMHIINHPKSISSAYLALQRFSTGLPVFAEASDAIIFKQCYDSLKTVYPHSGYTKSLRDEIDARENRMKLGAMLESAESVSFPDLTMPDVNGEMQTLSALKGKVIIVSFWSVAMADQKMFNIPLAGIYDKYHDSGLEIYQVSIDVDKAVWASVVKSQNLKWISVNDGYGRDSKAVVSYNVTKVPSMFVIDRNGNFAGRDVKNTADLESLIKNLL